MADIPAKGSTQHFQETVAPALLKFGLLSQQEAKVITEKLAQIESMRIPDKEKLGLKNRIMLQATAGYAGSVGARSPFGKSGFSLVNEIPK